MILDEPASALDADAEYRLFQHFHELITGKTVLLISHRLSTARMSDQILVLDGGRIVEAGSHAELMARGGHYASLYEMQAGRLILTLSELACLDRSSVFCYMLPTNDCGIDVPLLSHKAIL